MNTEDLKKALSQAQEQIENNCPADGKRCETKQCDSCPQFPARALLVLHKRTLLRSVKYGNFPEEDASCIVLLDDGTFYEARYEYSRLWCGSNDFIESEGETTHWILKENLMFNIQEDS